MLKHHIQFIWYRRLKMLEKKQNFTCFAFVFFPRQSFSCSARFLWKRIPLNIKNTDVELEKIHSVYICLWNNDIAGFFKTINHEWSNNIAELMFELRGSSIFHSILFFFIFRFKIHSWHFLCVFDLQKRRTKRQLIWLPKHTRHCSRIFYATCWIRRPTS